MGLSRKFLLPFGVLAVWIVLLVIAVPLAGKVSTVAGDPNSVELPRGADATQVAALASRFPDSSVTTGILIFVRVSGLTAADRAKVDADRAAVASLATGIVPPARESADGQAIALSVPLKETAGQTLSDKASAVRDIAERNPSPGLAVKLTGDAGASLDARDATARLARLAMIVTAVVVVALLVIMYRSPLLWIFPLLNAGIALVLSDAIIYLLGRYAGLTVDAGNTAILTVLVFGVGTDYALLLLARYRDELRHEADRRVAMRRAWRGAVPAIAASAATVSLGLLCLLAADMGFNYALGPAGAIAVLSGFAVMVTLLPAILILCGRWVIPRATEKAKMWDKVGHRIARRPRTVWIASALFLGALALGGLGMRTGLDNAHIVTGKPDSVAGQQLLAAHYPAGTTKPVHVVVAAPAATATRDALTGLPGVVAVADPVRSSDGRLARLDATLDAPADSPAAAAAVDRIRAAARSVLGAQALVGGATAIGVAKAEAQAHDRRVVLPLVLVVVFLVLVVLLRALIAPILLMLTVVLSYFAAVGAAWLVLKGMFPAMDIQVMLIGFLFLVALGVDYNIFLVSRIREEARRHGHRLGVLRGLGMTGGVITSAGIVLAATFCVLLLAPLVAFVEIGFVVALGVLIDTLLVRSVLVPALALDAGRWFWWPARPAQPDLTGPGVPTLGDRSGSLPDVVGRRQARQWKGQRNTEPRN